MLTCRHCKIETEDYTPSGRARRLCHPCTKESVYKSTKSSEAKRLLTAVRSYCRSTKRPEGAGWTLADVEALLAKTDRSRWPRNAKTRVLRIDPDAPFTPDNARIVCFGCG